MHAPPRRTLLLLAPLVLVMSCQGRSGGTMPPQKFQFQPTERGRLAACVHVRFASLGAVRAWSCDTEVSYPSGAASEARAQIAAAGASDEAARDLLRQGSSRGQDACATFHRTMLQRLGGLLPGAEVGRCAPATLKRATSFP
jgi:hypothetical protein